MQIQMMQEANLRQNAPVSFPQQNLHLHFGQPPGGPLNQRYAERPQTQQKEDPSIQAGEKPRKSTMTERQGNPEVENLPRHAPKGIAP